MSHNSNRLPALKIVLLVSAIATSAFAGSSDYRVDVIDLNPEQGAAFNPVPSTGAYRVGQIFFKANADDGSEVFFSDGTQAGTQPLLDVFPGPDGSDPAEFVRVGPPENSNSRIFFVAEAPASGRELWVTNGTPENTLLAVDFVPGPEGGEPASLIAWNGQLYLTADAGAGRHLYQVDRTTLASTLLGSDEFELELNAELVNTASRIYFAATSSGTDQIEIWSTDGTTVTQESTAGCESIDDLYVAGDFVFMVCVRAGSMDVLQLDAIQPDGTALIQSHSGAASVAELNSAGSQLYWVLDGRQLWGYDASVPLVGIAATFAAGANINQLARLGTRMLFVANSGDGAEPHVAEGFAASQLRDVFPGPTGSILPSLGFVPHESFAYFMAQDGLLGFELWRTDGTAVGTSLFADIEPGSTNSFPLNLLSTPLGLFFSANGSGLWVTDGVAVTRIDNLQRSSSIPVELLHDPIASRLFMSINSEGFGTEPWVSDGTQAGSFRLRDIQVGAGSSLIDELFAALPTAAGASEMSSLVFAANDGIAGRQLWQSDGTVTGTLPLATINPSGSSAIYPGSLFGEHYYFVADDGSSGLELWRTDATSGGTQRFADINPTGNGVLDSRDFAVFAGKLFFPANDGVDGEELWFTDGSNPPIQLADLAPGSQSATPDQLIVTPSALYFVASNGDDSFLWRSDGTEAGTEAILQTSATAMIGVGDAVYFRHDDGINGIELWRADADSVALALDLTPGSGSSTIRNVGSLPGYLVFHNLGQELWSIDDSTGQASLLGIFDAITTDSGESLGQHVYFRAELAGEGSELWRSDGLSVEMIDLEPGATPSNPEKLVAGNDRLYFFAYDSTVKKELHILSLLPAVGFDPQLLEFAYVDPGNTVEATVSASNIGSGTLQLAAASIAGINAADFSIVMNQCDGVQLAASESCSLTLAFAPTAPGLRSARLVLPSNAPGPATQLPLRGTNIKLFADDFEAVQ